jgi:hypothetical protein
MRLHDQQPTQARHFMGSFMVSGAAGVPAGRAALRALCGYANGG